MSERDLLAAEHALGLLEGEELLHARGLAASDADFARLVEEWQERLAPMFNEIAEAEPPAGLRQRVLDAVANGDAGEVVALKRRLGWWKGASAAASAIAASLALVVAFDATRPPPAVEQPAAAPVMVAALMSDDKVTMVAAAWKPADRKLMIMPGAMADAPGQDHELWVIPADGKPRSLGLVHASGGMMDVAPAMASHMAGGKVMLALSVEPAGGSPTGLPTGPVVASGQLKQV